MTEQGDEFKLCPSELRYTWLKEVYGFLLIVVMLENGPPPPPSPFKISLITKLSGSIIHYVQQHYTINIQKPLLIGRTIVVSSEKRTREKQQMYGEPGAPLFFFFFSFLFYTKMHREFCDLLSL